MKRFITTLMIIVACMMQVNAQDAMTLAMRKIIDNAKTEYNRSEYGKSLVLFVKLKDNTGKTSFEGTDINEWVKKSMDGVNGWTEKAKSYYEQENYTQAMVYFKKVANLNDVENPLTPLQSERYDITPIIAYAENRIGVLYDEGKGTAKDTKQAFYWYERAANKGKDWAQYNIGLSYKDGDGTEKNYKKAMDWFIKAYNNKITKAANQVGILYATGGYGITKDYVKAVEWYRKAADEGYGWAQYNLGVNYEAGNGVAKNMDTAIYWYKKAAAQDIKDAKDKLEKLGISTTSTSSSSSSASTTNTGNTSFTVKGVTFKMIFVKGSTFMMGGTSEMDTQFDNEKPVHHVTVNNFLIGETEVTQALWEAVMGSNPSKSKGANKPVESVSWNDCQTFITKLNSLTGKKFRLPTEAEWEFAARGGVDRGFNKFSGSNNMNNVAWYADNSDGHTHTVKTKDPNELGIYDMCGNVWEWVNDWMGKFKSNTANNPENNPKGPSTGDNKVERGGSFESNKGYFHNSRRAGEPPTYKDDGLGLRLAL